MGVLIKYLLQDMIAQYRRTLLILVTLLLSSAALLASLALADTMVALGTSQWRAENGYSDIVVTAPPAADDRFISEFSAAAFASQVEFAVYRVAAGAELESAAGTSPVMLLGYNLDEFRQMVPLHFSSQGNLDPFAGNQAVISRKTAAEQGLSVGDILTVRVGGNRHILAVAAIAYAEGPFLSERDAISVLVPYGKLQAWLGVLGQVDSIYLKLRQPQDKGRVIRQLASACPDCRVAESYSEDHIRLQSNRTAVPFIFMSVLLCFMTVYVLYVLFKGIVFSRLPLMGLFRAIGAYRMTTWLVLLTESALYGLAGGLASWLAGYGMLWIIIRILHSGQADQYIPLAIGPLQLLLALAAALATSLLGALACLISEGRASICQQIRGLVQTNRPRHQTVAAGCGVLAVSLLPVFLWRSEKGLVVYIICVIGMFAGLALLSPALYARLAGWLGRLPSQAGGPGRIALLNIRGRRDFAIAATIISIIVATTIVIAAISTSDRQGAAIYAARIKYALELSLGGLDDRMVGLIRQVRPVEAVCANYYSSSVEVAGQSIAIYRVHGVTPEHAGFIDYAWTSSHADPWQDLAGGRNILLTQTLRVIYQVREGDVLVLKIFGRDGRYRECPYTVIGFFDDWQTKLGRYALISQTNFREDFAADAYDSVYVRAGDADAAAAALAEALSRQQITISQVADEQAAAAEESAKIISAMAFIAGLTIITGLLGILNVTILAFLRRKRELGLYYALGLTAGGILATVLAEMFWAGFLGSAAGALLGLAVVGLALPRLIFALQIALRIYLTAQAFWMAMPLGMLVALAAASLILLFLHRSNPMDGLRQEE